ncbi:hypothetical protein EI74_0804 [Mycoplasma testudineum]|uniref:Uncharacterized protein n=1 Tax=Mycoplasma testudineum TaxID=244584 RepID=A0A4R6IBL3_9MOLU|nr:hypothetical protein [Mycoplasma testudineum]OYD26498.1 hypothetical protein CG473_03590 [Mycoplasma testudineum]TDO18986.1 hypothetical protein EI74_0804 [Mycoplasma testudineum]
MNETNNKINFEHLTKISKSQSEVRESDFCQLLESRKFKVTALKLNRQHIMDNFVDLYSRKFRHYSFSFFYMQFNLPSWSYPFKLEIDRTIYAQNSKYLLTFDDIIYANDYYSYRLHVAYTSGFAFLKIKYHVSAKDFNFKFNFFQNITKFGQNIKIYRKSLGNVTTNNKKRFKQLFIQEAVEKIASYFNYKDKKNMSLIVENGYLYFLIKYSKDQRENVFNELRAFEWDYNYSMSKNLFINRSNLLERTLDAAIYILNIIGN